MYYVGMVYCRHHQEWLPGQTERLNLHNWATGSKMLVLDTHSGELIKTEAARIIEELCMATSQFLPYI